MIFIYIIWFLFWLWLWFWFWMVMIMIFIFIMIWFRFWFLFLLWSWLCFLFLLWFWFGFWFRFWLVLYQFVNLTILYWNTINYVRIVEDNSSVTQIILPTNEKKILNNNRKISKSIGFPIQNIIRLCYSNKLWSLNSNINKNNG